MLNSVLEKKVKELEQELFLLNKKNQLLEEKLTQDTNLNVTRFLSKDSKSEFTEKINILELQIKKLVEDKRHMLILINKLEEKTSVEKKEIRAYNSSLFPEVQNDIKEIKVGLKKENQDINERIKDIFSNTKIPK
jgi:hypothetical protein